jgi:hypothetical protein
MQRRLFLVALSFVGFAALQLGCGTGTTDDGGTDDGGTDHTFTFMTGGTADCEFDVLTFSVGGEDVEVSVNGLTVHDLQGANNLTVDTVEMVTRRGVKMADVLTRAGITAADETPVAAIGRDGWDPFRTKLDGDTTKIPTFAFMRDHSYVFVGNPGDKDPLYPSMEGKSLMFDYDLATDADVPAYLGGALSAIGIFRYKMMEKVDADHFGLFQVDPTP